MFHPDLINKKDVHVHPADKVYKYTKPKPAKQDPEPDIREPKEERRISSIDQVLKNDTSSPSPLSSKVQREGVWLAGSKNRKTKRVLQALLLEDNLLSSRQ